VVDEHLSLRCGDKPNEECQDKIDNDDDGKVDCADEDCAQHPSCEPIPPLP
jgi:hypothetical protein